MATKKQRRRSEPKQAPAAVPVDDDRSEEMRRLGAKGGKKCLRKYGRKHFAELAAKRKTFGGGRPIGSRKPED